MLARLSLRARLVLGVIALAAVGLVAADVATYASLRSFLLDRTDSVARAGARRGVEQALDHGLRGREGAAARPGGGTATAAGDYVQVRRRNGDVVCTLAAVSRSATRPRRRRDLPRRSICRGRRRASASATSPSGRGAAASRYRVRASIEPALPATTSSIVATLAARRRQHAAPAALIELLVTGARARRASRRSGSGSSGSGCGRSTRSATTAAAIAAGDLSRASSARTSGPRSAGSGSR